MKENILVVFGGKSAEHDISIITGLQAISNMDREKYNVIPMYISRENKMYVGEKLCYLSTFMPFDASKKGIYAAGLTAGSDFLYLAKTATKIYFKGEKTGSLEVQSVGNVKSKDEKTAKKLKKSLKIDCAVLCCHGRSGEDGNLQGLLSMCGIPFTSCGCASSAICMDKIFMKDIIKASNFATAYYTSFEKIDYILEPDDTLKTLEKEIGYPMFIKPANLGSSIGISKCNNRDELEVGIEVAIKYDRRILVEKSVENNIEVNCAVLGNSAYAVASEIEFPKHEKNFLTFDEKYLQRKQSAEEGNKTENKITKKQQQKVKDLAVELFKKFDCKGVVRIDFLIDKDTNEVLVNELNTIPGSMAFYLFKGQFDFKKLLNRLIENAKKLKLEEDKDEFQFMSSALNNFNQGIKSRK